MRTLTRGVWLLVLAALLAGCASTSLLDVWHDRNYTGARLERILVVGFTENERNRRIFEDEFVARLNQLDGVKATSSIGVIPPSEGLSREQIEKAVASGKYDAVLMTRLLSIDKEKMVIPGRSTYFYDYYYPRSGSTVYYDPPRVEEYSVVNLETNLYRTKGMEMTWSATSESFEPRSVNTLVDDLSKLVIKSLQKDGLL